MLTGIADRGNRVGQGHGNAKLTDHERKLVLQLRADGWTYRRIAEKMEVSRSTVWDICRGQTAPIAYKEVK